MRLIDDFLYITPSIKRAKDFIITMHKGFPNFGCKVNESKTIVNFDMEYNGMKFFKPDDVKEGCTPPAGKISIRFIKIQNN